MFAGRIAKYIKTLRFRLTGGATVVGSGAGSSTPQWETTLESFWTTSTSTVSSGAKIKLTSWTETTPGGADPGWSVYFGLDDGAINFTVNDTGFVTSLAEAEIQLDVAFYVYPGYVVAKVSAGRFYYDGDLVETVGSFDLTGVGLANAYIPLIGVPPIIRGGGSWRVTLDPPGSHGKVTWSGSGGWGFIGQDDATYAWPVEYDPAYTADTVGGFAPGSVSVTDSFSASCTGYSEHGTDGGDDSATAYNAAADAYVCLTPTPDRGVIRLNDDYGALVARLDVPGFREQKDTGVHGSAPTSSGAWRYPKLSQMLSLVGNSTHAIEDIYAVSLCCPYFCGVSWGTDIVGYDVGDGDPNYGDSSEASFPQALDLADNASYLTYNAPIVADWFTSVVNMVNTFLSPGWCYFLWYPPDGLDPSSPIAWKVDGATEDPSNYWLPYRQQFAHHPDLPEEENTGQRLQVVTEPLGNSGLADFVADSVAGTSTSFWGVSRFVPLEIDVPETYELGNHDLWSCDPAQASLSFDGAYCIVTAEPSVTEVRVRLSLMASSEGPGYYNGLAPTVRIADLVSDAGSPVMSAKWVDFTGAKYDLGFSGFDDYLKPIGKDSRYAGTWAEDWGQGEVTDLPVDTRASGASLSLASDVGAGFCLALATARQYVAIEFTIKDISHAVSGVCKIAFPLLKRLYVEDGCRLVSNDHGGRQFVLQVAACAFRYGFWKDFDGTNILDWPAIRDYTGAPSALSAIAFLRWVKGLGLLSGLDTEIRTYYDYGIEFTQDEHLTRDPVSDRQFTTSFVLPTGSSGKLFLAMLNGFSECPPLCSLPNPARDSDWNPDPSIGFDNSVYSWVAATRHMAEPTPDVNSQVFDSGGTGLTSTELTSLYGWRHFSFDPKPLDGTEGDYTLRRGSRTYMKFRPWRGAVWTGPGTGQLGVQLTRGHDGAFHEVIFDGALIHNRNDWGAPHTLSASSLMESVDSASLCQSYRDGEALLYTCLLEGKAYYAYSDSDGKTIGSGTQYSADGVVVRQTGQVRLHDGAELLFETDYISGSSGPVNIVFQRIALDGSLEGPWTVGGGSPVAFDGDAMIGVMANEEEQFAVLSAFKDGASTTTRYLCDDDGATWVEV